MIRENNIMLKGLKEEARVDFRRLKLLMELLTNCQSNKSVYLVQKRTERVCRNSQDCDFGLDSRRNSVLD